MEFWLGLLLAVPLAIAGNLLTRPVQRWLDGWSKRAPLRRLKSLRRYIQNVEYAQKHPNAAYTYMALNAVVSIALLLLTLAMLMLTATSSTELWRTDVIEVLKNGVTPAETWFLVRSGMTVVSLLASVAAFMIFMNEARVIGDIDHLDTLKERLAGADGGGGKVGEAND